MRIIAHKSNQNQHLVADGAEAASSAWETNRCRPRVRGMRPLPGSGGRAICTGQIHTQTHAHMLTHLGRGSLHQRQLPESVAAVMQQKFRIPPPPATTLRLPTNSHRRHLRKTRCAPTNTSTSTIELFKSGEKTHFILVSVHNCDGCPVR